MKQLLGLSSGLCMMGAFCVTKMKHGQTIWFCRDELSLAMLFWEDIIAWLVCLKYYYFYVNIKLLSWIFRIWIFIPQLRRITLKICQVAFHIKNSVFYHLPTRGRAGIKLGDAWYVSNVSIIFDCSMLLFYLLWMITGFIIHFYITFGTNLLTRGPSHISVWYSFSSKP